MFSFLIAIVYLAFISLGLPDSLLGSAWPSISAEIGADISLQGIITMIIACSTILSSLFSNFLTNKLGTGLVTALSVAITAIALFSFSACTKFWQLCLCAIPYGLGAGAVDAALNNYAALHFSSRHMNWLHCFWGVGALTGPYVLTFCLKGGATWQSGYQVVGLVQVCLTVFLFATLPVWKKQKCVLEEKPLPQVKTKDALKIRGVWFVFAAFFCYCALEQTALQWASTHASLYLGTTEAGTTFFGTLFCTGIALGRFICGIFSNKISDKKLIRLGIAVIFVGLIAFSVPWSVDFITPAGLVLVGVGCGPVYPAIMHSTPINFGEENSQALVGIQMAFAYCGTTFMPPFFGVFSKSGELALPLFLTFFAVALLVLSELSNSFLAKKQTRYQTNI